LITWQKKETCAVISMNNGENKINREFIDTMIMMLDEIASDTDISSVVITSSDAKFWSTGLDIGWAAKLLQDKDTAAIKGFMFAINEMFKKILLYPMPVIASITGHAFGAGAIFSCICDFRFMRSDRGYFCFPEVEIGIPFLPSEITFIKRFIPHHLFQEMIFSGSRYGAADLEKHGVIQKACAGEEELKKETLAFANSFRKKRGIFGEMKRRLNKHIIDIMDEEDAVYIEAGTLLIPD
jgi:enoyl-CoA hydratase/carnithine racemase